MLKEIKAEFKKYRSTVFLVFAFFMTASFSFFAASNMNGTSAVVSTAGFNPGNIISDAVMANYSSMSLSEIQSFLTSKNGCKNTNYEYYQQLSAASPTVKWHWENDHFVCLSEERFGDNDNEIGAGQTAAEIIYEAAQDYHINPQVLLVLLEKETSLITDPIPNDYNYRRATGYGCPDTAACSSKYYGFKNQIRNAAWLFRYTLDNGYYGYPEKTRGVYVGYHPNSSCGGTEVYIENRATSALYRYTPYQPNAASLAAGYGTGDKCSSYGNRNFYLYFTQWFGSTQYSVIDQTIAEPNAQNDLDFTYQTHVAEIGWQDAKDGGVASGTVGQALQLEALKLDLGQNNTDIVYRSHIQNVGWESTWHRGGEISGTTGQSKAIESIQLQLIESLADKYDIYYRVHASDIGWMGWAKNGAPAGTTGQSRKVEAIQVAIVKKGVTPNLPTGTTKEAFKGNSSVARYIVMSYQTHIANIGWMDWVKDGQTAGTTGQSRAMEAISLKLVGDDSNSSITSSIQYRTYATGLGWMDWVKDGQTAGTTGQSRAVEAIEFKLPSNLADRYTIRYRVHVSDIGWMDWVKDGQTAGTISQNHWIEAIEIQLMRK